jgi:hypothetical protein
MRSLVLLNYPIDVIKKHLIKNIQTNSITLMQLMKIDSLFTSGIFSNEGIEQLLDQLKATLETTAKTDAPSALSPPSS